MILINDIIYPFLSSVYDKEYSARLPPPMHELCVAASIHGWILFLHRYCYWGRQRSSLLACYVLTMSRMRNASDGGFLPANSNAAASNGLLDDGLVQQPRFLERALRLGQLFWRESRREFEGHSRGGQSRNMRTELRDRM